MARRPCQRRRSSQQRPPHRPALLAFVAAVAVIVLLDRFSDQRGPIDASLCERSTLTGAVTQVRDGATIDVTGVPIRLSGIAAPEWDEPGGPEATAALREMVAGCASRREPDATALNDSATDVPGGQERAATKLDPAIRQRVAQCARSGDAAAG